MTSYEEFLNSKMVTAPSIGFKIELNEINPILKPHQQAIVQWMVEGGRRACFAAFGLGKSVIQIETVRITRQRAGGMGLIVLPLGVRQEFVRDAAMLGVKVKFIRRIEECDDSEGIYLTNYETVRDGKLNPQLFSVASLDEAACLRGFGGTKTFREFMRLFAGDGKTMNARVRTAGVRYRFVATATPSPNDYIELLAYAAYLDIMDVSAAKTRFFKRDSTKADCLTIHPHKEREFWLWVASWALFLQSPSDLGFDDTGYVLPEIIVNWHEVETDHSQAGHEKNGQGRLLSNSTIGVQESAKEKRLSLPTRIEKMLELRAEDPDAHRIIWHDLEAERLAIEKAVPGITSVYGNQSDEDKEQAIIGFSDGDIQEVAGKPCMLGSGVNFQRHCSWAIYLGIGFKFNDFYQSIHRLQRFLQTKTVRVDLIYTEAERGVRKILEKKWNQHKELVAKMTEIIREYGLSQAAMMKNLTRAMGVERIEITGQTYKIVNNDCVDETKRMTENSVGLILTSIPFSTQYEYSPNYADFGHTDNNEHFFKQMDFLTPELLRILQPGRIAAIHVKDRIVPGGMTGLGFQTVYPFHSRTIDHYVKHGFAYMGMKTIVTDVVRENNQTYRLGWTEQCKDATKMGVGMPEYLLLFRKPPTDTNGDCYPCPKNKGRTFKSFVNALRRQGYEVEHKELRACNYGAPTIRKRLFLIARCDGQPIVWPTPTHGDPKHLSVKSGQLKPWRTAAECIDWDIPAPSIFERTKPLAEATLRRIAKGIMRYVVNNPEPFIVTYYGSKGPDFRGQATSEPLKTQTTENRHALIVPFVTEHANASNQRNMPADGPLRTQCAQAKGGHFAMVNAFLAKHYGGVVGHEVDKPTGTVTTADHHSLVTAHMIRPFGQSVGSSPAEPVGTITPGGLGKTGLVTSHLLKLRGTSRHGQPVDAPAPTITAGGLHIGEVRAFLIKYYGNETEGIYIKEPMHTVTTKDRFGLVMVQGQEYQIIDIGMRMLTPRELFRAQGFPENYIIDRTAHGKPITKTAQVARCGNSVCPPMSEVLVRANMVDVVTAQRRTA